MLKISICLLVLFSNFLIAEAQADYSETPAAAAREFKIEKKSGKAKNAPAAAVPEKVSVPVMVRDEKGNLIDNLTAADFKIFVDDAEVSIASFQTTVDQPLNVIFLIDLSVSVDARLAEIKDIVQKLAGNLRPQDKVSLAVFNLKPKILSSPTGDRALISKNIAKIEPGYETGTAIYDVVADFFDKRLTSGEKNVVVMLTDGVDTVSKKFDYVKSLDIVRKRDVPVTILYLDTLAEANNPAKRPVRISGLGNMINGGLSPLPSGKYSEEEMKRDYAVGRNYLGELSGLSGGSMVSAQSYSALTADQIRSLAELLRPQYYLAFQPDESKPQGRIRIRINRPRLKINARSRY